MGWIWPAVGRVMEHLQANGIEPYEVMSVLNAPVRLPRPVRDDLDRPALTITGRTRTGRVLLVALRSIGGRDWEILAARELAGDEAREFERWEADRDDA